MSNESSPSKILLVAWETADWRMIHPLMDAGHLPTLNGLVDRGVIAEPVAATNPHVLTTGQPGEDGPPDRTFRPFWEPLSEAGRRCVVVRWPGTQPAAMLPNGGIMVSDQFRVEGGLPRTPAVESSVEPTRLRGAIDGFRLHPGELAIEELRAFVPELDKIDPAQAQPVQWLAGALADTATTHNTAVHLLTTEPWDFAAVSYTAISAICQQFLQFARSDVATTSPYRQVAATAWVLADQLLGRLVDLAGDDATVMVCGSQGMFGTPVAVIAGPGVKQDERLDVSGGAANVLDYLPTLRWIAGLPEDPKLPGKPWKKAWKEKN